MQGKTFDILFILLLSCPAPAVASDFGKLGKMMYEALHEVAVMGNIVKSKEGIYDEMLGGAVLPHFLFQVRGEPLPEQDYVEKADEKKAALTDKMFITTGSRAHVTSTQKLSDFAKDMLERIVPVNATDDLNEYRRMEEFRLRIKRASMSTFTSSKTVPDSLHLLLQEASASQEMYMTVGQTMEFDMTEESSEDNAVSVGASTVCYLGIVCANIAPSKSDTEIKGNRQKYTMQLKMSVVPVDIVHDWFPYFILYDEGARKRWGMVDQAPGKYSSGNASSDGIGIPSTLYICRDVELHMVFTDNSSTIQFQKQEATMWEQQLAFQQGGGWISLWRATAGVTGSKGKHEFAFNGNEMHMSQTHPFLCGYKVHILPSWPEVTVAKMEPPALEKRDEKNEL